MQFEITPADREEHRRRKAIVDRVRGEWLASGRWISRARYLRALDRALDRDQQQHQPRPTEETRS